MGKKILIFILLLLMLLTACTNQKQLPFVSLENRVENNYNKEIENENVLKVGIASVISPMATRESYASFLKYLEDKLDIPIKLVQGKTYTEMNQFIKNGEVDIALICSQAFATGSEQGYLQALAAPIIANSSLYRSYIIVRNDRDINSIKDLKNKSFAFTDPDSYSGRLAALYLLKKMGLDVKFFGRTIYTYSHYYSIKSVVSGLVDGAAVDSLIYDQLVKLNSEDIKKLKIIAYGEWVGNPPIVASNYLSEEKKEQIKNILFKMDQDARGREILKDMGIDKYASVEYDNYLPILDMLKTVGGR